MTGEKRGQRAIIAGAGIGGLSAAAAVAPFFDNVLICEKDELPERPDVRGGANQGAHVHVLLRGGASALEKLLPGLHEDFARAGAVELDAAENFEVFDYNCWRTKRPLGLTTQAMSRPAYEHVVRERVLSLGNVSLHSGAKVDAINFENGAAISLTVSGETQTADLIVDARGRGGALPRELSAAGFGDVQETVIGIVMSYVSGRFKRPPVHAQSNRAILVRPEPPDRRFGLVCPIENGEWFVSLGGRGDMVPPMELSEFFDYAGELATPEFSEFIEGAELVGSLHRYKKPTAHWRHFDQMETFPKRLIPLGDTITSFNPTFGQGMSVAAKHALSLSQALSVHGANDDALFRSYYEGAAEASGSAWKLAGNADLEYPEVSGERPEGHEQILAFAKGMKFLGNDDPDIQRLALEVFHMERSPACLQTEEIAGRVMAKLMEKAAE